MKIIEHYFKLRENKTTLRTEVIAGATIFVASMYIIIVNPSILSKGGMNYNAVLTATILVSSFSSVLMGLYARNPILIAPGMGINAYFTYSMVIGLKIPVETALGAVFWSGIVFLFLSVFRLRVHILKAIPEPVRLGAAGGIGLFIALIGLFNAHFIVTRPPFIGLAKFDAMTMTFLAGLFIVSILVIKKVHGALILSIILTTLLALPIGRWYGDASAVTGGSAQLIRWTELMEMPDFRYVMKMDLLGSLKLSVLPAAFGLLFTDMFDSISTFVGVAEAGNLKDADGEPRNIYRSMIADAFGTLFGGIFGSSSGTAFIESASGIQAGGRTGLTAVVAGLLFLPFMFFSPLIELVPDIATAPVLVIVGVFMINPITKMDWGNFENAIPAFLALIMIPLTYSITQGIVFSLLMFTVLKVVRGKFKELSPALIIIDLLSILLLFVEF
jgi:AGZA family xanthine/uracil permease-like MFS transporter